VKSAAPEEALQLMIGFGITPRLAEPLRQTRPGLGQSFNLNQRIHSALRSLI